MVQRWGEKGAYSGVFAQTLLEEMSCWDDIPPKREKDKLEPLGACHERLVKKNIHTVADRNATVNKQTKQISLSGNGEWRGQHK